MNTVQTITAVVVVLTLLGNGVALYYIRQTAKYTKITQDNLAEAARLRAETEQLRARRAEYEWDKQEQAAHRTNESGLN